MNKSIKIILFSLAAVVAAVLILVFIEKTLQVNLKFILYIIIIMNAIIVGKILEKERRKNKS